MKYLKVNELRKNFLNFFENKNHLKLDSYSLIPEKDNSLLLVNSGMAPMKNYFAGLKDPPSKRIVTCQKCIRTPDIEIVGTTSRHGTFFEMLGNFSFGDYFKKEAISLAFEFLIDVIQMPREKIFISVYREDNEAFEIWSELIDKKKIVKLGKDNFWEHGKGPCGPCSEIYFDRGEKYGCSSKDCGVGCDCDRYLEIWNLVFTQFLNDGKGNYRKLKTTNIDTGMGLERLAFICQNVDNFFLIDTTKKILDYICFLSNKKYGKNDKDDISIRIITDHIRSVVFMASDGILPSNEGRGYIMRKILRRAIRHGKILNIKKAFLYKVCDIVIEENKEAYESLVLNKEFIKKVILSEEENFLTTIEQGMNILESMMKKGKSKILNASDAFLLHDTYGFPIDLTKEIIKEKKFIIDEKGFLKLIEKQREKSFNKKLTNEAFGEKNFNLKGNFFSKFIGYDKLSCKSNVLEIFQNEKNVEKVSEGSEFFLIIDKTVFYPEGGGQVSDKGIIFSDNALLDVLDVKKISNFIIHRCILKSGNVELGNILTCEVDKNNRKDIERNHTAAHLLHSALRKILGGHVKQAGQFVNNEGLRFDFVNLSKLNDNKLLDVENLVNSKILENISVETNEMPINEAKKIKAIALFDEKYGSIVRVVKLDDFSIEFCSGTHVKNTSELCFFKIKSESSVSSGVRRIEAVTGTSCLKMINEYQKIIKKSSELLKNKDVIFGIEKLLKEQKESFEKIKKMKSKFFELEANKLLSFSKIINKGVHLIIKDLGNIDSKEVRNICDIIRNKLPLSICVFLNSEKSTKTSLTVCISKEVEKLGISSKNLVNTLAKIADGKGGGSGNIATAGVPSKEKLGLIFENAQDIINSIIKKVKI